MNAKDFFLTQLTNAEKDKLLHRLQWGSVEIGGCLVWQRGLDNDGYGRLRYKHRKGHKLSLRAHRVMYYIKTDCRPLSPLEHISHRCHNKKCVKFEHLSRELAEINMKRNACRKRGKCGGHGPYKKCLFGIW